jgi:hypothetical protein
MTYEMKDIPTDTSFLEMLDILNEQLIEQGEEPVAFDHDCREGICGMCSLYVNGHPHGPATGATTCQLYMRRFHDGETITVEPWRSAAFPVIRDLMVDRRAFDKIQQAGGYISFSCGGAQDANAIPVSLRLLPTRLWTQHHASAAVLVSLPARTVRLCSLYRPRLASSHSFHKDVPRLNAVSRLCSPRWMNLASVTALILVLALPSVLRTSSSATSHV